jgi:hypothetical protein
VAWGDRLVTLGDALGLVIGHGKKLLGAVLLVEPTTLGDALGLVIGQAVETRGPVEPLGWVDGWVLGQKQQLPNPQL